MLMVLLMTARLTCSGWWDFAFNIKPLLAGFVYQTVSPSPASFTLTLVFRKGRKPSLPGSSIS